MQDKLIFIAGPCVIESRELTFRIAEELKEITSKFEVDFIFKASFDKANRTSIDSFRGPGLEEGLEILKKVKGELGLKVLSDVHCVTQVDKAAQALDIIQIPAFLCRQTDLITKAASTGLPINVKKGQFVSPDDMRFVIDKITSCGNKDIFLTERGTCFGYNNLVVDFRSFGIMKSFGYPVIFDVTHSVQRPSQQKGVSGGDREFVLPLARAAAAFGIDGIFCEVHINPDKALSDKATSLAVKDTEALLKQALNIRKVLSS